MMVFLFTECVNRVEEITGKSIPFYKVDLLDKAAVQEVFKKVWI